MDIRLELLGSRYFCPYGVIADLFQTEGIWLAEKLSLILNSVTRRLAHSRFFTTPTGSPSIPIALGRGH